MEIVYENKQKRRGYKAGDFVMFGGQTLYVIAYHKDPNEFYMYLVGLETGKALTRTFPDIGALVGYYNSIEDAEFIHSERVTLKINN